MPDSDVIPGLKLIRQNSKQVNNPDDPSFPFKLEVSFSPPEFMEFTFVSLYGGTEEIAVRGMTEEALKKFVEKNGFRTHPRLIRLTITGPDGIIEKIDKAPKPAA